MSTVGEEKYSERQVIEAGMKEKKGWSKDECSPRT